MQNRQLRAFIIAASALSLILAIAAIPLFILPNSTHATSVNTTSNTAASGTPISPSVQTQGQGTISTINGLTHMSVVGSTQFILDKAGHTAVIDPNPHDVQIVPPIKKTLTNAPYGSIHSGDLVATNIGAQRTGNILVLFPARVGPGHQFNTPHAVFSGLAKEAFNTETGTNWVTDANKNNVEVFNPTGSFLITVSSKLFQKPWGIAFNGGTPNPAAKSTGSFFVANAANATIDRIDIVPVNGNATFKVTQIAQFGNYGHDTKIALTWAPTLMISNKQYTDVLLALDPVKNRVAAFANSTTTAQFTDQGITAFQGKPLNNPGGITLNPLNNDLLIVNLNDNTLLELNSNSGAVVGSRLVDNIPVDLQTSYGSALSGVTAGKDPAGNLVVYFTDSNTNTIDMLGV